MNILHILYECITYYVKYFIININIYFKINVISYK